MKNRRRGALLLALVVGTGAFEAPAWAATTVISHPLYGESTNLTGQDASGKPDGMDDATWTALQDDVIEYSEIPNLVEYRSILGKTQTAMIEGNAGSMVEMSDDLSSMTPDMRDMISDLKNPSESSMSTEEKQAVLTQVSDALSGLMPAMKDTISYLKYQAESSTSAEGQQALLTLANMLESSKNQTNSGISTLVTKLKQGLYPSKVALIAGMNSAFVGYQSLVELRDMYQAQVEMYQRMLERSTRQQALGSATALDVQQAQVDLQGAQLSLSKTEEQLRSVRDAIALTLGWNAADAEKVTIGALPAYDANYMAGRNLEADIAEARLHNVSYGSAMSTVDRNLTGYTTTDIARRSAEQNLNITMTDFYNAAVQAGTQYESAQLGFQIADRQKASADRMFADGMVSATDYTGAELQYIATKMQADISAVNASAAVLSYQAALQGILS